jgi:hypothetical protein
VKDDFSDSTLFKKLSSEMYEINKLKWIESEKTGRDIGINQAIIIWVKNHRKDWWGKN